MAASLTVAWHLELNQWVAIGCCQRGWGFLRRVSPTVALARDVTPGKSPAASEQRCSTSLCSCVASPACPSVSCHLPSVTSAATATTGVKRYLQETTACWWTRHPCSIAVWEVSFPRWVGKLGHEIAVLTWEDCTAHGALQPGWFQTPQCQTLSEVSLRNNIWSSSHTTSLVLYWGPVARCFCELLVVVSPAEGNLKPLWAAGHSLPTPELLQKNLCGGSIWSPHLQYFGKSNYLF